MSPSWRPCGPCRPCSDPTPGSGQAGPAISSDLRWANLLSSPLLPRVLKTREQGPEEGAAPTWPAADLGSRASHSPASARWGPRTVAASRLSSGSRTGARGGASRTPGSGGGDRPARRRRETVAWKLGRRRSLEQTAAEGRAQQRRAGGGAAWTRSPAVAPEVGSRASAGGRRGGCGRGPASRTPRGCRPPEGAAERSGPTRTGAGSGPSQHLAVLALHPKLTPTPEPCHGHQTTHRHTTPHSLRAHSSLTPACACACDWGHSNPAWHLHMR